MLDDLSDAAPRATQTELRTLLGCFLFSEDDVFKRSACSPAANATATRWRGCCWRPSNFLLLDEPTNHLDMRAKDVLLESLRDTPVRWFSFRTTAISSTTWPRGFSNRGWARHVFPGNYEDYLWRKAGGPEAVQAKVSRTPEPEARWRRRPNRRSA